MPETAAVAMDAIRVDLVADEEIGQDAAEQTARGDHAANGMPLRREGKPRADGRQ